MRKRRFCGMGAVKNSHAVAVRHVSSCERWLMELPVGMFRGSKGKLSHCEKACIARREVKNEV